MAKLTIVQFLTSQTVPALEDYPIEEAILAIDSRLEGDNFLDKLAEELEQALDMAERWRILNTPIDKIALELQTIAANAGAYEQLKENDETRTRVVANILDAARVIAEVVREVRSAVRQVAK